MSPDPTIDPLTAPAELAEPVVRRRLRSRPPGPVRNARALFSGLGGYLVAGILLILMGVLAGARGGIEALIRTTLILGPIAFVMFAVARLLRTRQRWAFALGLLVSLATLIGTSYGFTLAGQVIGEPNPTFLAQLLLLPAWIVSLAAVINLVRARSWFTGERERPLRAEESGARPIASSLLVRDAAPAPVAAREAASTPLVTVQGLKKHFPIVGGVLRRQVGTVYAVDGVDFEIMPGETFSLVGESGCGKTTLGRTLLQLTPPTEGRVVFDGYELSDVDPDDMRPLRRRMQIIFQDPFGSLNPRMPVSDIIGEGLLAQGLTDRKVRDERVKDALELVGLRRDYTRRYPHEFSGGQRQRIGVARALALGPDFIVADEPVSALDVSIQSQVLNLLLDLKRELNLTYLFISHNLAVVQYLSDRVGVMYLGKIVELGTVDQLYRTPRHPYTVALLSAIPDPNPRRRTKRLVLKGELPSPAAPPSGCRFHTRCWLRERLGNPENCVTAEPALRPFGDGGQRVACHWTEEMSAETVSAAVADAPRVVAAAVEGE